LNALALHPITELLVTIANPVSGGILLKRRYKLIMVREGLGCLKLDYGYIDSSNEPDFEINYTA
jgi:hypothetical protein